MSERNKDRANPPNNNGRNLGENSSEHNEPKTAHTNVAFGNENLIPILNSTGLGEPHTGEGVWW